jgi:cytochrome c biogenesis protein CcdA
MMVPFLGAGAFAGWATTLMHARGRWLQHASFAGGVVLVAMGIAVFTNLLPVLAGYLPLGVTTLG